MPGCGLCLLTAAGARNKSGSAAENHAVTPTLHSRGFAPAAAASRRLRQCDCQPRSPTPRPARPLQVRAISVEVRAALSTARRLIEQPRIVDVNKLVAGAAPRTWSSGPRSAARGGGNHCHASPRRRARAFFSRTRPPGARPPRLSSRGRLRSAPRSACGG